VRFHSTPESALNGEITKLAIIETTLSVGLYVWAGLHFGSFRYLALAMISAPLMLFRTRASAQWGLKLYGKWINAEIQLAFRGRPLGIAGALLTPAVGALIRVLSTVYGFIRRPHQTLTEIPLNWVRQCLCTDSFYPPEITPLEALTENRIGVPSFPNFLWAVTHPRVPRAPIWLIAPPFIVLGWLPSLIYRVSFKATAIAYAPIIWLVHSTLQSPFSLKLRLERTTKGEIEKARRWLSGIIGTLLLAKFALIHGWIDRTRFESYFPSTRLLETVLAASHWPWWQMTLGADALLTFLLLYFADAALARLDTPHAWREPTVLGTLSTFSFLRGAFSLATITHFFLVALARRLHDWRFISGAHDAGFIGRLHDGFG
jgi:hypothetical protein